MVLFRAIENFKQNESGAVTVDWVVLTAAIVGLGMLVLQRIGYSIEGLAMKIAANLDGLSVGYGSW